MKNIIVVRVMVMCENDILLLKRSSSEELYSSKYELPGGKPKDSEDLEVAAIREVAEETGIKLKKLNLFHAYAYSYGDMKMKVNVITYKSLLEKKLDAKLSEEHTEFVWVNIKDVMNKNSTEQLIRLFEDKYSMYEENNTTNITEVKLYTDGGSRGNPGPSALGYVIYDLEENVVKKGSKYLGITTNNQAEYQAVKSGLEACSKLGAKKVSIYMDSQLVANQMNGIYKIKNRDLWPIHESIKKLSANIKDGVDFIYVPREFNKEADAMVNYELDRQDNIL